MTDADDPLDPAAGRSRSRRSIMAGLVGTGIAASLVQSTSSAEALTASSEGEPTVQMPGGRRRALTDKLAERASILDFDVDPNGRNDSSEGFHRAIAQLGAGQLFVPKGTYLIENLGILGGAGLQIVGDSRWKTIFKTEAGAGPLFYSQVAGRGTSAFHLLSDFMIDLNNQGGTAIDLSSINASTVQRIHISGGAPSLRRGIGVRFAAPIQKGAYDNALYDCTFEYLDRAVVWGAGANTNSTFNCRLINCGIGYDIAPGGEIDTPKIFGGRVEGCGIGLREGALYGSYFGVRFENNDVADIEFTARSAFAGFWGCFTATTSKVIKNRNLARGAQFDGGGLERQPDIADDRSGAANSAAVNQILATLRRRGLIG